MFIGGAVTFIEGAVTFVEGAIMFVEGAITFIGEGGSAVGGGLFKTAGIGTRVVNSIKGVNKRDLRRQLITYKLKGPLLLRYSLISTSNYSIGSSS